MVACCLDAVKPSLEGLVAPVLRGGALVMRPLLLHAFSKAVIPCLRRVLHFVFGSPSLPLGLEGQDARAGG